MIEYDQILTSNPPYLHTTTAIADAINPAYAPAFVAF